MCSLLSSGSSWRHTDIVLCSVICSSLNWFCYKNNNTNTNSNSVLCEEIKASSSLKNTYFKSNNNNKLYDFVIIGYGRSGKSAVETLNKLCPKASIAIFDPSITTTSINDDNNTNNMDYYQSMVNKVNPECKEIVGSNLSKDNNTTTNVKVNYKHSMLISTGSRCASIPSNLVDKAVSSRVLSLLNNNTNNNNHNALLSPKAIYAIGKMACEQNSTICVLGSGLEALFIALSSAYAYKNANKENNNNNNNNKYSKVKLLFGDSSPLSRMLPSYLSTTLTLRLRKLGIDVQERTLVRYVMPSFTNTDNNNTSIEIHAVKSYDSLLTERLSSDLIIVAPSTLPHQTTASIPTSITSNNIKPWSQIISTPNIISCFSKNARILVNAQLNAASNIYASGSCVQYPDTTNSNNNSGSYIVPGLSLYASTLSGQIAATNMAQQYNNTINNDKTQYNYWNVNNNNDARPRSYSYFNYNIMNNYKNPPIWSTNDIYSKLNIAESSDNNSIFKSSGIQAFTIGECNSHTMSIHAFWWTNHSTNIRKQQLRRRQTNNSNSLLIKATTASNTSSSSSSSSNSSYPVYGVGVLYYVDNTNGKLRGILTWGINPNSILHNDSNNNNGNDILERLRLILQTNGQSITNNNNNKYPITIQQLSDESQNIIHNILNTSSSSNINDIHVLHPITKDIIKPYYRYTPSKNSVRRYITSNNFGLKRCDMLGASNNNHSFISNNNGMLNNNNMPFLIPRSIQSIEGINNPIMTAPSTSSQQPIELQQILSSSFSNKQITTIVDNCYARPSKEDSIWMYQGEEDRLVSSQQKKYGYVFI